MKTNFRLSNIFSALMPLFAVIAALAVGIVLLLLASADPIRAYGTLLLRPFSNRYGLTETLVKATPLLLVGLGIVVAFRAGILNIGAEGQMIVGAIAGTWIALSLETWPAIVLLPLTLLAGALGGAIWGGIPGWLEARLRVNELLSTIMLNQIAWQLLIFLLRGPLIDPKEISYGTGYPQSAQLPEASWLPRLVPQTRLHAGLLLALMLAGLIYVLMWRTIYGYRLRAAGAGPDAARYAGIHVPRQLVLAMVLSGALAGLAGTVEVVGIHHRLLDGISAGYGFSGIVAALFGRLHPLGVVPASVLFWLLGSGWPRRFCLLPSARCSANAPGC